MDWKGVIPAITTAMDDGSGVHHDLVARHCRWLVDSGCTAIVCCGSLGEAATLSFDEKLAVLGTCIRVISTRASVAMGIAAASTLEAVELARRAEKAGAAGLMVLPPYVYSTDWREMKAHVSAVMNATSLSCMLYNNPAAYKTDFLPEHIAQLAKEHPNLHAVKESSGDARRITAIKALVRDRLTLLVGMDDAVVEGVAAGAEGWIAGLANVFPEESIALFEASLRGEKARVQSLYDWFLPLLRLDTLPKFVQYIKWLQSQAGRGNPIVRAPRLPLDGAELDMVGRVLAHAIRTRSQVVRL